MKADDLTLRIIEQIEKGHTFPEASRMVGLSLQATRMRVIRHRRIGEQIITSIIARKYRRAA